MSKKKINLKLEKLRRKENLELLKSNHVYSENMEHDACGVGLVSSTDGKKSRQVVEYGIEALKACLLYTSPSPRDRQKSRMPSSA